MSRLFPDLTLLTLVLASPACAEVRCPDLALVLAIDSSSSIDDAEYALQMRGYETAFRDPEVLRALSNAGRVDVAVVIWAGPEIPKYILPWREVSSASDASHLADWFSSQGRQEAGDTDIGNGLSVSLDLLEQKDCGLRRVVNVSGDGRASAGSSHGPPRTTLSTARARAAAMGVTVNGLAITNDEEDLNDYYRTDLITGPGCFVMDIDGFNDFPAAIIKKLRREIEPEMSAQLTLPSDLQLYLP